MIGLISCSRAHPSTVDGSGDEDYPIAGCTVYETDTGATVECSDGTSVEIRHGTDGADGANGQDGSSGSNGSDGQDGGSGTTGTTGMMTDFVYCETLLPDTDIYAYYNISMFSAGHMFVNAGIYGVLKESNNSVMYSNSNEYAYTAPVYFTDDLLGEYNGGYWRLHLDRPTMTVIVDYVDVEGTFNWVISSCTHEQY